MSKYCGPKAVHIYKDGKILRKPRITMATVGLIQLDKIVHLRCALESTSSQIKENEAPILIGKQKPLKCLGFQNRFIKRFIAMANKKLNMWEVPKTKEHTMDMTPPKLLSSLTWVLRLLTLYLHCLSTLQDPKTVNKSPPNLWPGSCRSSKAKTWNSWASLLAPSEGSITKHWPRN